MKVSQNRMRKGKWRRRCPRCRRLRRFDEGDGNHGGEKHANPGWYKVDGVLVCGWCVLREDGVKTFTTTDVSGRTKTREVSTGRALLKPPVKV